MLRFFFKLLFDLKGWKCVHNDKEASQRCVMIGAPHTSNFDFVYAVAAFEYLKIPWKFTIKKEWIKPPFGKMMVKMGAIGINRKPKPGEKKPSMVDGMVELFNDYEKLALVVTPEGTRSKVNKIKSGFYRVAMQANVPIGLGFIDYGKKEAGVAKMFYPTGNYEADLKEIAAFYKTITAKFPENNSFMDL